MVDYAGNSNKGKEAASAPEAKKKEIKKVVDTEVIVKPKGLGRKIKSVVVDADFKGLVEYVITDVMIPAARNMLFESVSKGAERAFYGVDGSRRRYSGSGTHISYNNPLANRNAPAFGSSMLRGAPPVDPRSRSRSSRDDIILSSRDEAELVLETMTGIASQYDVVSWADLNEMLGLPVAPIDTKWGWVYLGGTKVVQVRDGWLIDLPPAEPIS
jgi:hypothetical protein